MKNLTITTALATLAFSVALNIQPAMSYPDEGNKAENSSSTHENFIKALTDGKIDIKFRYRYGNIDHDAFVDDSRASTFRTMVGYKTGKFKDVSAYVQFRNVTVIGAENYNDTINGRTTRPPEADPAVTEVDQAYVKFDGIENTSITVGRRKLKFGNQRFVSDLGWRQNNRSFDGVVIENSSIKDTELKYAYALNVNRAFTDDSPVGNFDDDTNVHLINATYKGLEIGKIEAYAYLLDLDGFAAAPTLSTATFGANLTGKKDISDKAKFLYTLEYAHQTDYQDNPASYDVHYFRAEPGVSFAGLTLKAGYEELGSDGGTSAFTAPLGLLHAYNGWADLFLATPATGLEDVYGKAIYKVNGTDTILDGTKFIAAYHDFSADSGGADYGSEWNFAIIKPFLEHYTIAIKFANYDADTFAADVNKIWFTVTANF